MAEPNVGMVASDMPSTGCNASTFARRPTRTSTPDGVPVDLHASL